MPYKELTLDHCLGRVLVIAKVPGLVVPRRWRIVEGLGHGNIRCITETNSHTTVLRWPVVRTMIADGSIEVE